MQKEITSPCRVFEDSGEVMNAGWARQPLFIYNAQQSKSAGRHSERDCYFINNGEVSLYLCAENYGREFAVKIAVADLKRGGLISDCVVKKLILSRNELPDDPDSGEFFYTDKRLQLRLTNSIGEKILLGDFIDFGGIKNLYFRVTLKQIPSDTLSELAPFERNRRYFYFKHFSPAYTASGVIRVGGMEYNLTDSTARAYFDRARFMKPRRHNYQRLSCDGVLDGKRFTLNLASRVGDNRYGNENCFFLDGGIEKLSQLNVSGTPGRLDRPFYFKGGMNALDITFKPYTVKGDAMSAVMDKTTVVFGRLFGTINRINFDNPLTLDNLQAHLIFSDF